MSAEQDSDQVLQRRANLDALRAQGNPYPNDFERIDLAGPLSGKYGAAEREALETEAKSVRIAWMIFVRCLNVRRVSSDMMRST